MDKNLIRFSDESVDSEIELTVSIFPSTNSGFDAQVRRDGAISSTDWFNWLQHEHTP